MRAARQPGQAPFRPAHREPSRCRTRRRTGPACGPRAPSAPFERPPHVRPQHRRSPDRPRPLNCVPAPAPCGNFELPNRISGAAHRHQGDANLKLGPVVRRAHLQRPAQFSIARSYSPAARHAAPTVTCAFTESGSSLRPCSAAAIASWKRPRRISESLIAEGGTSRPGSWPAPGPCRLPPNASNTG